MLPLAEQAVQVAAQVRHHAVRRQQPPQRPVIHVLLQALGAAHTSLTAISHITIIAAAAMQSQPACWHDGESVSHSVQTRVFFRKSHAWWAGGCGRWSASAADRSARCRGARPPTVDSAPRQRPPARTRAACAGHTMETIRSLGALPQHRRTTKWKLSDSHQRVVCMDVSCRLPVVPVMRWCHLCLI